jgi:hypothetical protein
MYHSGRLSNKAMEPTPRSVLKTRSARLIAGR